MRIGRLSASKTACCLVVAAMLALSLAVPPPAGRAQASPNPAPTDLPAVQDSALATPAITSIVVNGDFESGPSVGWEIYSDFDYPLIYQASQLPSPVTPHGGSWAAWLGREDVQAWLAQDVAIPTGTPVLTFYYWISSSEADCDQNVAWVGIGSDVLAWFELCASQNTNGWVLKQISLSSYAGQTLSLQFMLDNWTYGEFFLDDVSIAAGGGNNPPVANPQSVTTMMNTAVAITLTGSDPDSDPLTFSVQTQPLHGTLSGTAPNLTYTPATGYIGSDSFTFLVNDGQVNSDPATVSITVTRTNQPPVANPQSVTTAEDVPKAITVTGSDPDGDPLTYHVQSGPSHGTLSGTAPNLTYTPAANYNGADSFTFVVNDGFVDSPQATVSITVTPVNDAPVAVDDAALTEKNASVMINVAANDTDVDGNLDPSTTNVTCASCSQPSHGTLVNNGNGTFTYTPAQDWSGLDSFVYQICDTGGLCDTATVTVYVSATPLKHVYLPFAGRAWVACTFYYFDDFGNPNSGWGSGANDQATWGYVAGEYQIQIKIPMAAKPVPRGLELPAEYAVEVDVRQDSNPAGFAGLLFGYLTTGSTYKTYQFSVNPQTQEYLLEELVGGGRTPIIAPTVHTAIHTGAASNHLRVQRVGTAIRLYVNGTQVGSADNGDLVGSGLDAGLRLWASSGGQPTAYFDNFLAQCP